MAAPPPLPAAKPKPYRVSKPVAPKVVEPEPTEPPAEIDFPQFCLRWDEYPEDLKAKVLDTRSQLQEHLTAINASTGMKWTISVDLLEMFEDEELRESLGGRDGVLKLPNKVLVSRMRVLHEAFVEHMGEQYNKRNQPPEYKAKWDAKRAALATKITTPQLAIKLTKEKADKLVFDRVLDVHVSGRALVLGEPKPAYSEHIGLLENKFSPQVQPLIIALANMNPWSFSESPLEEQLKWEEPLQIMSQPGFPINEPINSEGDTLLHYFCCGSVAGIGHLIKLGANPNVRNTQGETPLHTVCHYTSHIARNFKLPRVYAEDMRHVQMINELRKSPALDVNARDNKGRNGYEILVARTHPFAADHLKRMMNEAKP